MEGDPRTRLRKEKIFSLNFDQIATFQRLEKRIHIDP